MEIMNLLPIGSVVRLNGGTKKVMIIGMKQTDLQDEKEVTFDYLAVLYPEGFFGGKYKFLFNHEDIDEIYYKGYDCDERTNFLKTLDNIYIELDQFK